VFTIGHGNRTLAEFLALLRAHGITRLVDVRAYPRSRHNPAYDLEALPPALAVDGIAHTHLRELGGRRRARPDSVNLAWRNEAFRGYADHMYTEAFHAGLDRLLALAAADRVAIMCAETVPWRCHRSLIADALVARGVPVLDILGDGAPRPHALPPHARVRGGEVSYPAPELFPASGSAAPPPADA
jgi:uncharacterized protein (DUF488 family)